MANKKIQLSNGTDNLFPITSVIAVTTPTISALPTSDYSVTGLTENHKVLSSQLSNPSTQIGDWTVTTNNGSFNISGLINGSTTVTLVFYVPDDDITIS